MNGAPRLTLLKDALPILGFTATKASRLAREGQLPSTKIGGLWYLVDIEAWLDARAAVNSRPSKFGTLDVRLAADPINCFEQLMPQKRQFS